MLVQREDFIRNNRANTKTKIRACNGSTEKLQELLKHERALATIYEDDGAHDTAYIIRTVNVPLIQAVMGLKESLKTSA